MAGFIDVTLLVLREFVTHLLGSWPFWLVIFFIALQYRKAARDRLLAYGGGKDHYLVTTAFAAIYGIAGGLVGSLLLILTGINLASIGISYLWGVALLLMLFNPRFLCFAYSGGIIALCSLFFGSPVVNIPQLMGLIAALHLIESLLIYLNGHTGATPMTFKKADGRLVGGFSLQKFWPLPIVAVAILPLSGAGGLPLLPVMPAWWPLIGFGSHQVLPSAAVLLPLIAGLGYGDVALTHTPAEKSRISARQLGVFSLVLLALAITSAHFSSVQFIAAAFAPLGHEMVIFYGRRSEMKGRPLYIPSLKGVRVLGVMPGSPASKAGIATGDVVYSVNGIPVNSKGELEQHVSGKLEQHVSGKLEPFGLGEPRILEIEFITRAQNLWRRAAVCHMPGESIGLIAVPEGCEQSYIEIKSSENFAGWLIRKIGRI